MRPQGRSGSSACHRTHAPRRVILRIVSGRRASPVGGAPGASLGPGDRRGPPGQSQMSTGWFRSSWWRVTVATSPWAGTIPSPSAIQGMRCPQADRGARRTHDIRGYASGASRGRAAAGSRQHVRSPPDRRQVPGHPHTAPAWWTFVHLAGVEPTHKPAERAMRPGGRWRTGRVGTPRAQGSRCVEAMMTVLATLKHQHRPPLDDLTAACEAALRDEAVPS